MARLYRLDCAACGHTERHQIGTTRARTTKSFVVACDECGAVETRKYELPRVHSQDEAVELQKGCMACSHRVFKLHLEAVQMKPTVLDIRCPKCSEPGHVSCVLDGLTD